MIEFGRSLAGFDGEINIGYNGVALIKKLLFMKRGKIAIVAAALVNLSNPAPSGCADSDATLREQQPEQAEGIDAPADEAHEEKPKGQKEKQRGVRPPWRPGSIPDVILPEDVRAEVGRRRGA